jgi:hypothetical protein
LVIVACTAVRTAKTRSAIRSSREMTGEYPSGVSVGSSSIGGVSRARLLRSSIRAAQTSSIGEAGLVVAPVGELATKL